MRRFKKFLCLLGVLLLVGAIWAWRSGTDNQRIWAHTLDEAKLERKALFLERDKLPINADRQARLMAWSKSQEPVVRDGSITVLTSYSIKHFTPQTLRWRPEVDEGGSAALRANQKYAQELDVILREGPAYYAGWATLPADATDAEIGRHQQPLIGFLDNTAEYWFVEALTTKDPERALAAWDRIIAAKLVLSGQLFPFASYYVAHLRDAAYLNLIVRERLSDARLQAWLREPGFARADFADEIRLRRAVYVSANLAATLQRDRNSIDHVAQAPARSLRTWWYARNDGPRDADRIIRNLSEWEQWLRGEQDAPPATLSHRDSMGSGRYTRGRWQFIPLSLDHLVRVATQHRNARLLGAALASRSRSDGPLWIDHAAFRQAVGDAEQVIAQSDAALPSRYERLAEGQISLGPVSDLTLPPDLEAYRKIYFPETSASDRKQLKRCVTFSHAHVFVRLPGSP